MFMSAWPLFHPAPIQSREMAFLFALLAVFAAFCMISTLPYRNFTNAVFNRRIDIRMALFLAIVLAGLIFYPRIFLLVSSSINVLSGPVIGVARALKRTARRRPRRKEIPS
jgi:phosphatidylserine synthase